MEAYVLLKMLAGQTVGMVIGVIFVYLKANRPLDRRG